jgi:hypothetical protein
MVAIAHRVAIIVSACAFESSLPIPRKKPSQHRQQHPIRRGVPRAGDLSTQHRELMPQYRDLHVPGARRRTQPDQPQQTPHDQETQRPQQHDAQSSHRVVPAHSADHQVAPFTLINDLPQMLADWESAGLCDLRIPGTAAQAAIARKAKRRGIRGASGKPGRAGRVRLYAAGWRGISDSVSLADWTEAFLASKPDVAQKLADHPGRTNGMPSSGRL